MYISMKNLLRWLLLAFLTSLSVPGWAVIAGSAQPASAIIPLAQPTTLNVTWLVTTSPSQMQNQNFTLSSSFGQFVVPNMTLILCTVNTTVSGVATGPIGMTATAIITEAVKVPQDISVRAMRAGATSFSYSRQFSDGTTASILSVNIQTGGSGSAGFGISRMALTFDDGAVVRVVPKKNRLSAAATVSYQGSGLMTGYWEVADPSSTSGSPIFRQLKPVSRGLGGAGRTKVSSPELPTSALGLYMVRLRLTAPLPGFEPPVLYYYVGEAKPGTPPAFMPMTVMNPPNRAYIDSTTPFSWQPVKGARAYKIEIFASPETSSNNLPEMGGDPIAEDPQLIRGALSRPPMAGMLVTGKQTRTVLSASTRAKLLPQHSYFWRIQAIGTDGSTVGEAQVRELRIP
jgi:hypothetical protein